MSGQDESIFAHAVKILFVVGLVVASLAAFFGPTKLLSYSCGGTGIVTAIIAWKQGTRGIVVLMIALVVSLSAILQQPFNQQWLTDVSFLIRIYCSHVGLVTGVLGVLLPRPGIP